MHIRGSSLPIILSFLAGYAAAYPISSSSQAIFSGSKPQDAKVLILGGGVAGVIAARTLHEHGIDDFLIVEAGLELGGRLKSVTFGAPGSEWTVEAGANWVQGTQTGGGPANPIWELARKHGVELRSSHYFGNISTYDDSGAFDFRDVFQESIDNFAKLNANAGARVPQRLVDMTARSGYSLSGAVPATRYDMAAEYYQFDWEFGATPEETSWLGCSWAHNNTFEMFSDANLLSVDQRGFATLLRSEAATFLDAHQLRLNATVTTIRTFEGRVEAGGGGVSVVLADGTDLRAEFALCTFSLGVLQHDDVVFDPPLPAWKREAIHSMSMGAYTKIFLQFKEKFWFDTEMALYADYERGRYPVWQSLDHPDFLPGSGILFVTVTGAFSRRIESLPTSTVTDELLSVLRTMYPHTHIPTPRAVYFARWGADPRFRGAYANWPANFLSEHQANLRADVAGGRLWFAGEATSKKWFGYLHGAYSEGKDVGAMLAACVKDPVGCETLEHVEIVRNAEPYDLE